MLWIRILHFAGVTLWVSGVVSLAVLLGANARSKLAGILADIGATLAIVTGLYNAIHLSYFSQPWLHIKLTLVAIFIGIHVSLRVKMRKQSPGSSTTGLLAAALLVVLAIIYVIVMRPLGR